MAKEKLNIEAMYQVRKSLWFTKDEVSFVAFNKDVILVKFRNIEDRTRILNLMPWLFNQCLFAMLPFIKGQELEGTNGQIDGHRRGEGNRGCGGYKLERQRIRMDGLYKVGRDESEIICTVKYERYQFSATYVALLDIPLRDATRKMNTSIRVTLAFNMEIGLKYS
ncbi:hypothetical protein Goari_021232 [Gossypium aridum]|uniref:DUF4283 domain-containing protein n=1 Tax=Gossypium aridum TaxID=34290 RepID=A0A7J8YDP0_GOSAI|nr:hypothetical protein [Gossypium aridum]